ncbi:YdcF family protein [Deinococcus malanensis]|uniref:YdcF family protein n=1 Tax=Deinococcus malanensis TaxID=1706855 RepID=UPI00166AFD98
MLQGAALGCALATLAAFLGEVRMPAPLVLLLIIAGAVAAWFPLTWRVMQVGCVLLAGVLALCLLTPVLRAPLRALILAESPVPADAIVVLGGGVQCGTRTQAPGSAARLMRGLELWRAGYAKVVTVSEPSGLIGPADCPRLSALQRDQITALYPRGGPEVLTLLRVTTTRDEAARVRRLAEARSWERVLLVTSPSHSRRAAGLFRSYGLNVASVPASEPLFDTTLPLPSDRLYALRVLLYEGLSRVKARLGGTPER